MKRIKVGATLLGKKPTICAVLQDNFKPSTLRRLKRLGISLVELRFDQFKSLALPVVARKLELLRRYHFSIIGTIRSSKEGGAKRYSELERLILFRLFMPFVDAVDIELSSKIAKRVIRIARSSQRKVIGSFHDFKKTPSHATLQSKMKLGRRLHVDIVKVATVVKRKTDFSILFNLTTDYQRQGIIIIAMGKLGVSSRFLFPFFGSLVTYGSVSRQTAPGQPSVESLAKVFEQK